MRVDSTLAAIVVLTALGSGLYHIASTRDPCSFHSPCSLGSLPTRVSEPGWVEDAVAFFLRNAVFPATLTIFVSMGIVLLSLVTEFVRSNSEENTVVAAVLWIGIQAANLTRRSIAIPQDIACLVLLTACSAGFVSKRCLEHPLTSAVAGLIAACGFSIGMTVSLRFSPDLILAYLPPIVHGIFACIFTYILLRTLRITKDCISRDEAFVIASGVALFVARCGFMYPTEGAFEVDFFSILAFIGYPLVRISSFLKSAILLTMSGGVYFRIFFFWMVVISMSLSVIILRLRLWLPKIVLRKSFHVLILVVFAFPTILPEGIQYLSYASVFAVLSLLLIDCVRLAQIPWISIRLNSLIVPFMDERDQRGLAITPIYLLLGCAVPVWLDMQLMTPNILASLGGIIGVAVGDGAAAIVGHYRGIHKWTKAMDKSIDGSVAMCFSIIWCIGLYSVFVGHNFDLVAWGGVLVLSISASLFEAFSSINDNIAVSLFTYLSLSTLVL